MQGITTQDNGEVEKLAMANCLTHLSQINNSTGSPSLTGRAGSPSLTGRDFKCKTCTRQFPTFQALGGHRASHKKSKLSMVHSGAKPKTHKCSICGVEFEKGQALGGHMRRHVSAMKVEDLKSSSSVVTTDPPPVPVFKKSSSSKRILCDDLDLDLKLGW